jgi:hypothetical protein
MRKKPSPKPSGKARAAALQAEIEKLTSGNGRSTQEEKAPPSPREFIHRWMATHDKKPYATSARLGMTCPRCKWLEPASHPGVQPTYLISAPPTSIRAPLPSPRSGTTWTVSFTGPSCSTSLGNGKEYRWTLE